MLDRDGVGQLVRLGTSVGEVLSPTSRLDLRRAWRRPSSIAFCNEIGINYVSCSPFRVPVARLAAAQASRRPRRKKRRPKRTCNLSFATEELEVLFSLQRSEMFIAQTPQSLASVRAKPGNVPKRVQNGCALRSCGVIEGLWSKHLARLGRSRIRQFCLNSRRTLL